MADAATAVRDWLRSLGHTASVGGPIDVADNQLVVNQIGGTESLLETALLQIDVWGTDSYESCAALNRTVKKELVQLRRTDLNGDTIGFGASGVTSRFLPDPEADRPRFAITTSVTVLHAEGA